MPLTDISTNGPIWYIVHKAQWQWLLSIYPHPYPLALLWCLSHFSIRLLSVDHPPTPLPFRTLSPVITPFFPVFACFPTYRIIGRVWRWLGMNQSQSVLLPHWIPASAQCMINFQSSPDGFPAGGLIKSLKNWPHVKHQEVMLPHFILQNCSKSRV